MKVSIHFQDCVCCPGLPRRLLQSKHESALRIFRFADQVAGEEGLSRYSDSVY